LSSFNIVIILGRPRLLEGEYENMDDISRDEVPVPLTDALTTAFGGNAQVIINF